MPEQKYIDEVFEMLLHGNDELDVLTHLQSKGIAIEACQEIIETAKAKWHEEKLKYLPKKNKTIFFIWLSLTFIVFVLAFFILPRLHLFDYAFFLRLTCTIALTLCGFYSIAYYKSWTPEFLQDMDSPRVNFSFLPILFVPALIMYFIFSWRFSSEANKDLVENKVKASGTIISGSSISSKRLDFSDVTVRFTTKEGKTVVTTEDVSKNTFKGFYIGQTVELIYSSADPTNIDLLTPESDVRELTGSEERDLRPQDLIDIRSVTADNIEKFLDKICFGWSFREVDSAWVNNRRHMFLWISTAELRFITQSPSHEGILFPKYFTDMGFEASAKNSKVPFSRAPNVFEKDDIKATVQLQTFEDGDGFVVTIVKK